MCSHKLHRAREVPAAVGESNDVRRCAWQIVESLVWFWLIDQTYWTNPTSVYILPPIGYHRGTWDTCLGFGESWSSTVNAARRTIYTDLGPRDRLGFGDRLAFTCLRCYWSWILRVFTRGTLSALYSSRSCAGSPSPSRIQ